MKPVCLQGAEKTAIRLLRMAGVMLWLDFQSANALEKKENGGCLPSKQAAEWSLKGCEALISRCSCKRTSA
jgi:hypothetical protein